MSVNILQYESKVWSTADLLIGAGIKQSDFPKFMMPYFALIMVESRLVRYAKELEQEIDRKDIETFVDEFKDFGYGYNDFVIRQNKTLKDICKNDKAFDLDFHAYLKAFDPETKYLLGVDKGNEEEKFLDISGISGQLNKKKILFNSVKAWSEIDLEPFTNSEITTLEEKTINSSYRNNLACHASLQAHRTKIPDVQVVGLRHLDLPNFGTHGHLHGDYIRNAIESKVSTKGLKNYALRLKSIHDTFRTNLIG